MRALAGRLARAHWLHWLLIGAGAHFALAALKPPDPVAVIGPSADELAEARKAWFRRNGRPPSADEAKALATQAEERAILFAEALRRGYHLDDPLVRSVLSRGMRFADQGAGEDDAALFRRAIERGLHRHDPVVRRRMAQRVEMSAASDLPAPSEAALRALYGAEPERYWLEPSVRLTQRFFSADRHARPMEEARRQLAAGAPAPGAGNPFLHGDHFPALTPTRAARLFGDGFARVLFALPASPGRAGHWQGPLRSAYGAHLVQLADRRAGRRQSLGEVRERVGAEWRRRARREAVGALLERLRERYVLVDAP